MSSHLHWTVRHGMATRANELIKALGLVSELTGTKNRVIRRWVSKGPPDDARAVELAAEISNLCLSYHKEERP